MIPLKPWPGLALPGIKTLKPTPALGSGDLTALKPFRIAPYPCIQQRLDSHPHLFYRTLSKFRCGQKNISKIFAS